MFISIVLSLHEFRTIYICNSYIIIKITINVQNGENLLQKLLSIALIFVHTNRNRNLLDTLDFAI